MTVRLLYFASFRESAGRDEELRELPDGTRVGELWARLAREIAPFRGFREMPPAAVNREHASAETLLADGDEVTFLPPVAGG